MKGSQAVLANRHQWVRVTPCDSIPLREGRAVTLGRRQIAIFNLGGRFLATDNQCPHRGGPLCDGIVAGDSVVCPFHAFRYNLHSGECDQPNVCAVDRFPTRVENGIVWITAPRA